MAILLHNLSARTAKLSDAEAVAKLLTLCDTLDGSVSHRTEKDVVTSWQQPGFNPTTDAWVVVTNKGQFVGYASLAHSQHVHIHMQSCVHPSYRKRGIGTLLLRLAEVRARQHIRHAPSEVRVTLTNAVDSTNAVAKNLLEHEGYSFVHHFWRIVIETDEASPQSSNASQRPRTHRIVLDVSTPCATGSIRTYEPFGLYTVRQYDVYEKELRAGLEMDKVEAMSTQLMAV